MQQVGIRGVLALVFVALVLLPTGTLAEAPRPQPNVVLILVDDQGWGATSVQMDDRVPESASDFIRTPHLERLAATGVRFSSGYAPHPNCSPSRYSILTGKSPAKLRATDIPGRFGGVGSFYHGNRLNPPTGDCGFKPTDVTLPEWIKKHRPEYAAAHFGKWHVGGGGPKQHGFDASDGATGNAQGNSRDSDDPKQIFGVTRRSNAWMATQVEEGRPFYLQVSHYATHLSMQARPSTLTACNERPAGARHRKTLHAAMSEDLDAGVGQLLAKLDELGIRDDTYVIYVSDNGTYPLPNPSNTNGPLHGWKTTVWDGGIRVPFIISGPGISPGQRDARVVAYDLFPTVCEWLGIDTLPEGIEGGSLVPALKSADLGAVDRANDFLVFHWPHYQLRKASHPATAIYRDNYKLLKFYETGELRLYDLHEDLAEVDDLSDEHPETVDELRRTLEAYLESVEAGMPVPNPAYRPESDPGTRYEANKKRLMSEPYFLLNEKKGRRKER